MLRCPFTTCNRRSSASVQPDLTFYYRVSTNEHTRPEGVSLPEHQLQKSMDRGVLPYLAVNLRNSGLCRHHSRKITGLYLDVGDELKSEVWIPAGVAFACYALDQSPTAVSDFANYATLVPTDGNCYLAANVLVDTEMGGPTPYNILVSKGIHADTPITFSEIVQ